MTIDLTKPVKTRDGRTARIVSTNLCGPYPIAAVVERGDGETLIICTSEGKIADGDGESSLDLMNVPEKHEAWINIYHNEHECPWVCSYQTKEEADYRAAPDRISCVRVEYEIGDGV